MSWINVISKDLKSYSHLSKKNCFICFIENFIKMIKNAFYNQGVQSIMCLLVLLKYKNRIVKECAKFRGSRAIVGLVGLVPSFYHAFLGISWIEKFFSWVFRGSKVFSRGCLVDPIAFLRLISWFKDSQFSGVWERVTENRNT